MHRLRGGYIIILLAAVLLCYGNSFNNAFVWDDINNIVLNEKLNKPMVLSEVFFAPTTEPYHYYRPLPYMTIWIDHALWGLNTFGYHF